jgi:hypothetical protein
LVEDLGNHIGLDVPSADAASEQVEDCRGSASPVCSDSARWPAMMLGRPCWFE